MAYHSFSRYLNLRKHKWYVLGGLYSTIFLYTLPIFWALPFNYDLNICQDLWYSADSTSWFDVYRETEALFTFLLPAALMIFANWWVVRRLRLHERKLIGGGSVFKASPESVEAGERRSTEFGGATSGVHGGRRGGAQASAALVRISIALTLSFVVCSTFLNVSSWLLSYDVWEVNSEALLLKLANVIANTNMTLNPLFTVLMLPSLRRQIRTFFCGLSTRQSGLFSSHSVTGSR